MTAYVFLGPTMAAADAAEVLDATYLPPVRLGDVYRVVAQRRPSAIGIVDGYFQWTPAVWHKEILWAMGRGVHVFGAASMGALRAAELAPFGMHGIGRIFEAYRDGRFRGLGDDPFEDDDEVAVVHGPQESGYRGGSEAMVNIRCTLARAVEEAVIAETTRRTLVAEAKAAFFPDRGYAPLLALGRARGLPETEMAALERWLPNGRVDQKRLDAVTMLDAMRAFRTDAAGPCQVSFALERTISWQRAKAAFRATSERRASRLAMLRLDPEKCEHIGAEELRDWYFERVAGIPVPADLDEWVRSAGYRDQDEFHRHAFAGYLLLAAGSGASP